jgi:hypothetical protein
MPTHHHHPRSQPRGLPRAPWAWGAGTHCAHHHSVRAPQRRRPSATLAPRAPRPPGPTSTLRAARGQGPARSSPSPSPSSRRAQLPPPRPTGSATRLCAPPRSRPTTSSCPRRPACAARLPSRPSPQQPPQPQTLVLSRSVARRQGPAKRARATEWGWGCELGRRSTRERAGAHVRTPHAASPHDIVSGRTIGRSYCARARTAGAGGPQPRARTRRSGHPAATPPRTAAARPRSPHQAPTGQPRSAHTRGVRVRGRDALNAGQRACDRNVPRPPG